MSLTFGSLFAGIGGFDLGFERAGMECLWQVEIDPFCQKVLAKHWPDVERFSDVRECGRHNLPAVDVICGGFPCQDVSLAGQRAGLEGKRSTLWSEFYRIICEISPRWVVAENVPGLYSSDDGRFLGKILRQLAQGGYDAEWDCIPAAAVGAPHIRERVFILAYPKGTNGARGYFPAYSGNGQGRSSRSELDARYTYARAIPARTMAGGGWKASESPVLRVADGVPDRVDRLRVLGNAVVPQVAEWIGRRIVEADR